MSVGKFITGLVSGALVGGSVALLKNPNTGKRNRELVKEYTNNLTDAALDMQGSIAQAQNAVTDLAEQGMSSAKIARDDIQKAIQDFQNTATPQYNAMQKKINQTINDLEKAQVKFQKNK